MILNFQILVTQNFLSPVIQNSLSPVIQNFLVRMSTSSTVPTRSAPPAHPTEMGCGRSPWPAVESIRSARSSRSSIRPARSIPSAQPAHARERGHPNLRYACRTKVHSPTVQIAQFSPSQQISNRSVQVLVSRSQTTQFQLPGPQLSSNSSHQISDRSFHPRPDRRYSQPAFFFLNFDS